MRDVGKDPAFDDRPAAVAQSAQRQLVGNRWALAGAIMYLLEWVAIVGVLAAVTGIHGAGPGGAAGVQIPTATGTTPADIFSGYTAANAAATALSAGWYGLVLPGRILLIAGIRQALRRSWGDSALADLAVAAMALSVLMEIASYWVAAGVGQAATSGADQSAVVTGHAIASMLNVGLFSPLGLSILAISVVMWQSRVFPWWLCLLGGLSGAALCVGGLTAGFQTGGQFQQVANNAQFGVLGFWVWMLITGVILFRAAGQPRRKSSPAPR
ncbi:MAG TPA: hypothetical protein VGU71_01770 [Candidatus Dormibacteraeota bacterium]|nr:hypothetical protein [Candidatus Dormibacteraeota bacterium]